MAIWKCPMEDVVVSDNITQTCRTLTDHPEVSVIMNCLNCSKFLGEAINSVYAQSYDNWEIIFWDNASTDNSAEIAGSYDEKLRYFRGEKTVPLGHARNLAIGKARGEYVAFLDCDDMWVPEKLEMEMGLLERKPDLMLAYSNCDIVDSAGNTIRTAFDSENPERGYIFNELLSRYNFIPLLTVVAKKEVLDEMGLFPEDYKSAADYDLFLKVAYKYPVDYIDRSLAKYRVHEGNFSQNQDVGIKEELEIINGWLHKDSKLKNELGMKIQLKKMRRYAALYLFYLVKYGHLPERLSKFY